MQSASPVITLVTDFGCRDAYAGVVKGVVLRALPGATVVDLTHGVPPHDVRAAALALESAFPYFPGGTVHVAVVDPGVGGPRRILAADAGGYRFLGPDNGVLVPALERAAGGVLADGQARVVAASEEAVKLAQEAALPPGARESATFHGRDRFAPLAALLARGANLDEIGAPRTDYVRLALPQPVLVDGEALGEVIYLDTFGNLVTNLRPADLAACDEGRGAGRHVAGRPDPELPDAEFEIAGRLVEGLSRAYVERGRGEPLAIVGSTGRVEISVREESAAEMLGARAGTRVVARPVAPRRRAPGGGDGYRAGESGGNGP